MRDRSIAIYNKKKSISTEKQGTAQAGRKKKSEIDCGEIVNNVMQAVS